MPPSRRCFWSTKRRPKWQETTGGIRTGFIARTIGGDAQEIAPKVPVVIVTAEAQHGRMAAMIAIIVPTMDKVEKDGVPATNSAVVGTTEAAATGFALSALLRGSTDSATRATGTIDRAMRIASEATEAMAAITAEAAEGIAATAGTMARIVVGRWRGIPAFAGIGVTPAAARRTRTTAAVMEGRSVASGIAPQTRSLLGLATEKQRGGVSRISAAAAPATTLGREIASARM